MCSKWNENNAIDLRASLQQQQPISAMYLPRQLLQKFSNGKLVVSA
eukprot:SAG31_NODE_32826_length_351_cov_0.801587_1_plen_45_part_10